MGAANDEGFDRGGGGLAGGGAEADTVCALQEEIDGLEGGGGGGSEDDTLEGIRGGSTLWFETSKGGRLGIAGFELSPLEKVEDSLSLFGVSGPTRPLLDWSNGGLLGRDGAAYDEE